MKKSIFIIMIMLLMGINVFAADQLPGSSLYNIDTKWTTQNGQQIQLKELQGHPVLLSMVYLTCKYSCPTVISEIQNIVEKLKKKTKGDLRVVLVSFDPERDTPEKMMAYMKKRKLDPKKWTFLTNKSDNKIRELAAVLGFKYQKSADGEFTHSFMITALNRDGVIGASKSGAASDDETVVSALNSY